MSNHHECVFCRIISGEIKGIPVYEDDKVFVMLDIRPASPKGGHTLIMPKKHYELITDVPDDLLAHMIKIAKKVGKALSKFSEGFNIVQNNGKSAGQFVPHVHFHLIPRFENDGITIEKWTAREYPKGEIEKTAEKIRKLIKAC